MQPQGSMSGRLFALSSTDPSAPFGHLPYRGEQFKPRNASGNGSEGVRAMLKNFGRPLVFFDGDDKGGGGADPDQNKDKSAGDGKSTEKSDAQLKKEFTQEQLDKLFGDTRKQGREALAKEILEKTSFKSIDEVYAALDAYRKAEDDKLGEVDKAKKIAEEAKARNDKLEGELRVMRFERDFDKTVLKLQLEFQNDKARDVAFKLLDIETAGKGEKEMEEAVKDLLKEDAYLFADTEPEEIDATRRGKTNQKTLKKEIVQEKQKTGRYSVL
jgi:hypothetical protein